MAIEHLIRSVDGAVGIACTLGCNLYRTVSTVLVFAKGNFIHVPRVGAKHKAKELTSKTVARWFIIVSSLCVSQVRNDDDLFSNEVFKTTNSLKMATGGVLYLLC
jgi:hypothetical protein